MDKRDFGRVFKKGKTVKNSFFFIRFLKNEVGHGRAAIVVTVRVSKKSTIRNRLKRIMSEAIKTSSLLGNSFFDVIFVATSPIVGKSPNEIKSELTRYINTLFVNPS